MGMIYANSPIKLGGMIKSNLSRRAPNKLSKMIAASQIRNIAVLEGV
jgi:hypothetical protein